MDITFETNRDETRYTFYSLNVGDVFEVEKDSGGSVFVKVSIDNAFDLVYNKLIPITSGHSVHKLDAELIIHERAKGTGIY